MPTLADQIAPKPQQPSGLGGWLASIGDEMAGAFARYGRRSGAQRDASLALMSQASAPGTDPIMGAGQKLLGLAGLITHPLAFFPTREEWDQRLQAAGNDGRMSRSIGGFLSDLPSLIDPQMAAGGAVLATAPLAAKMAKPGLGKGLGDLLQDAANNKELDALGARLQAEASQVGGSPSTVSREQALQGLVGGAEDPGIIAYHGSPHNFDKFDMSKIGTGEGNQAYGHGLYFAQAEDTAKTYREALSAGASTGQGPGRIDYFISNGREIPTSDKSVADIAWMMKKYSIDPKSAEGAEWLSSEIGARGLDRSARKKISQYYNSDIERQTVDGRMYQVKINVKPDELLDWDKPLSEQPQIVQDAIHRAGREPGPTGLDRVASDTRPVEMKNLLNSPEGVNAIKAKGVKGIRYKDQGSRGTDGGTYNYVVFDDKLITILKKYGIPMTAGVGGAMMVAGQDMPPELASQMGGA